MKSLDSQFASLILIPRASRLVHDIPTIRHYLRLTSKSVEGRTGLVVSAEDSCSDLSISISPELSERENTPRRIPRRYNVDLDCS